MKEPSEFYFYKKQRDAMKTTDKWEIRYSRLWKQYQELEQHFATFIESEWIDCKVRQPEKGGEYNVVWNLKDGNHPLTTTMEWDAIEKRWRDDKGDPKLNKNDVVLYWKNLPEPPKVDPAEWMMGYTI